VEYILAGFAEGHGRRRLSAEHGGRLWALGLFCRAPGIVKSHAAWPPILCPSNGHRSTSVLGSRLRVGRPLGIVGNPDSQREWIAKFGPALCRQPQWTLNGRSFLFEAEDWWRVSNRSFLERRDLIIRMQMSRNHRDFAISRQRPSDPFLSEVAGHSYGEDTPASAR